MDSYPEIPILEKPSGTVSSMTNFRWLPIKVETKFLPVAPNLTILEPSIELFNIPFTVRHGEDYVFVESPQWPSLRTYGKTAQEAIKNMLVVIRDVTQEYIFVAESELADDAIAFRRFLIQKLFS